MLANTDLLMWADRTAKRVVKNMRTFEIPEDDVALLKYAVAHAYLQGANDALKDEIDRHAAKKVAGGTGGPITHQETPRRRSTD